MKFKVNRSSLCALAATLAICITPPMTLAQESRPWKPLNKFLKGVNTSGVYGNDGYGWAVGPSNQYILTRDANGVPATFSAAQGIGRDTTNPARIAPMLDADDFLHMRFVPGTPKQLFDHVVFNIEPRVFGAQPDGSIPLEIQNLKVDDNNFVRQNYIALLDDIAAARSRGMSVILAMHSQWITPVHQNLVLNGPAGEPQKGWQYNWRYPLRVYPGPFRADWYTRGFTGNPKVIDQNHPLPKFWKGFVGHLIAEGTPRNVHLDDDIAFRLSGEPLADFYGKSYWGGGFFPFVQGLPLSWWEGLSDAQLGPALQSATSLAKRDHRQIELEAIKAIWNNYPEAESCRILAQVGEPWPGQFGLAHSWGTMGNNPSGSFTYEPYTDEEFLTNDINNPDLAWSVAYVAHIYEPFSYTHARTSGQVPDALKPFMQYEGVADDYGNAPAQLSWRGPWDENISQWAPPFGSGTPNYEYRDYVLKHLTNPLQAPGVSPLKAWRDLHDSPPMIVTEFGVQDRTWQSLVQGDLNPPTVDLQDPSSGPPGGYLDLQRRQRARWHYDVRTWLERQGIRWSVWDMYDMYPTFWGSQTTRTWNGIWDMNPPDRYQWPANVAQPPNVFYPQFYHYMGDALFGDSRP